MSKAKTKRKSKPKPTVIEVEATPDFFDHKDVGGKDKFSHDTEILLMEWVFFYPNHSPSAYLEAKGYGPTQVKAVFRALPAEEWPKKRVIAQDKLTGELVRRHVDLMAKVQDEHISASKLGLARAVQMLADGKSELLKKDGKPVLDKDGNPRFKQFRSIDLLNCMSSVEKAQKIYRTAMGLSNEDGGLDQILNKLDRMRETPTILSLTQNNLHVGEGGRSARTPSDLSYDDVMALIEIKREQKAKQAATEIIDERLRLEHKEGLPVGDFTAMPKRP